MTGPSTATESRELLRTLAGRVRTLRGQRGWSRAELAERSGLSVRFLARVEGGDGNISVLRLHSLAAALSTSADQLVRPGSDPSVRIFLVGLRGAGKSTVGPLLADRIGLPFQEMDQCISEASGLPLDQLFELHGERHYRRLERETTMQILTSGMPSVVAAAGGIVNDQTTWELLVQRATVIWLKARPEDHWNRVVAQGDRRPMADNPEAMEELRAMLLARERIYSSAHFTVDTSGLAPHEVVERIRRFLIPEEVSAAPARSA